jgi:ribose transport system substrate-binding protein
MAKTLASTSKVTKRQHRLATVSRACGLLKVFVDSEERLTLAELSKRARVEKTAAFRLVHTLEEEGFLRKADTRHYTLNIRLMSRKWFRLGYAAQSFDSPFSSAVTESLRRAAADNQIDLVMLDNHYSPKTALRAAEQLIAERVDVAVEFQTFANVAPMVSALFQNAGIPLIAVDIPHPGATFYGVDNYRVGVVAGQALGRRAREEWKGQADQLLLLGLEIAGPLVQLRLSGAENSLREALPGMSNIRRLDTRGEFMRSFELLRKHLRRVRPMKTLIVGVNDPAVLGALRAFEETGLSQSCAAIGFGAIPEARAELRRPGTRLIGSVGFFPERYGEDLVRVAGNLLQRRHVPPAVYAQFQLITPQNVNLHYPMDRAESGSDREIR